MTISAEDLLRPVKGEVLETGVRQNVAVGIGYLEPGLRDIGCVPLFNLMDDAVNAEISRSQLWQWIHDGAKLNNGSPSDSSLFKRVVKEELSKFQSSANGSGSSNRKYRKAADLLRNLMLSDTFVEFLTLRAHDWLDDTEKTA